ncbi:MAG: adenosylmethionine--8-amino-7-oxononanoate transaminase [Deltaproteobacteria bacterium]|nr:adenosylmethionine--8-amino-7-oxononanoate transaminase [Deltaproteobacteria bacterium]
MTSRNDDLAARDRRHIWHPFTQMREWMESDVLVIERGEGVDLIDANGRRYLDGVSSLWTNVHGHRHPTIDAAIRDQLDRIAHSTLLGLASSASIEFADRLCALLPESLSRVFFSDNGSTAAEVALKIAFSYFRHRGETGRTSFITFDGAYHGDTIGSVSVGAIELFHENYRPLLFPTRVLPYPHCYRCPFGLERETCESACFGQIERRIEAVGKECVAIVIEPLVQGASGMRKAPPGFLRLLRSLADRHGLLLIVDEVATGFGRTGTMFAFEQEDARPDLLALAKGITGGYLPLAVTIAREHIFEAFLGEYDEFKTFFHGHTYTGNPLACAAGLGTLRVFDEERTLESLPNLIRVMSDALGPLREHPHVGEIRQTGLMVGIEIVRDRRAKSPFPVPARAGHRVCMATRDHGVIIRPLSDVVVLNPPLAIPEDRIRELVAVTARCIDDVTRALAEV